jgi:hypothetical protein
VAPAIKPATLAATAELCVDLARLLDGRDVQALLARASEVLGAKGIMIWSADAGSEQLRPSLAHGYSEKVLRKLQPLAMGDENITSQTYRTMKPQSMNGNHGGDSMAIAVPLISTGGCVGVMARRSATTGRRPMSWPWPASSPRSSPASSGRRMKASPKVAEA